MVYNTATMEKDKNPRQINQNAPINLPIEPEEKAPSRIVWRIFILGAVLVVLIILSIGIIKLVPKALSSLASVNVSISSLFTPSKTATSTATLNQNNSFYSATSTQNQNNYSQSASTSAPYPVNNSRNNNSNYNYGNTYTNNQTGTPDLQLTITSIGVLDRNTGAFVPTTNVNTNDRVAVKFQVENVGQGPSGAWNLSAALPAVNVSDQTKYLYNQVSIPAGMAVSGELYFDYVQTGQSRVVQIAISDSRGEVRTNNNSAQVTINSTSNTYNNYPYNNYPYNNNGYTGYGVNGVDLSVRLLSAQSGVAQFQVTNIGNQSSGPWTYTITSNSNSYNNYSNNSANTQASLAPGQTAVVTVNSSGNYGNYSYGSNSIQINVDPYNQTNDVNRSNNYASANI